MVYMLFFRSTAVVLVVSFHCHYSMLSVADEYACPMVDSVQSRRLYDKPLPVSDTEHHWLLCRRRLK